ncbi:DNA-binding protein [Sinomonas albida]|uniref:DNA-binding protein n=1 Tax=Sinomonas albida TaxID=369942 RepID=UPI0010A8D214|nr:DNA-binding protein [Sinomonas albida]
MAGVSVKQAAESLGVQPQTVRKMIRERVLELEPGMEGVALIISSASLARARAARAAPRRRGRAWSARVAWAAIDLLAGGRATWLNPAERHRLRNSLVYFGAADIAWLARNRASVHRYRATSEAVPLVAEHVIATAGSAVARSPEVAAAFGLTGGTGFVDGYVPAGAAQQIADAYGLAEDPAGNVVLREAEFTEALLNGAPLPAVALDLADSTATRERSAGLRYLEERLADG